jgi:hypothetical protein
MKQCPRCNRLYTEDDLNFCLDDGELLQFASDEQPTRPLYSNDPPPTVVLDPPRATDPIGWQAGQPIGQWQGQAGASPQTQYQSYPMAIRQNQTLAILSLCLGAGSLVVGWCCSNGLLLAPAGIVLGIIALTQIKRDPQAYGGKGLAFGGIAAGSAFLAIYLLFVLIYGLAAIGGALSK